MLFNLPADLGQDDTQETQQLITNPPPHQQPMRNSQVYTGHSSQFVSSNSQMHGCHRVRPYSLQRNDFPIQQDQYQDPMYYPIPDDLSRGFVSTTPSPTFSNKNQPPPHVNNPAPLSSESRVVATQLQNGLIQV